MLKIVHLDHVNIPGGAEMALARMLRVSPGWDAAVLLPRGSVSDDAVFCADKLDPSVQIIQLGPAQPFGASGKPSPLKLVKFGYLILAQAISIRTSRSFRDADVIHANSTRSALYGVFATRRKKQAFVVHLRDIVSPESMGKMGFRLFSRLVLPRAHGVIGNSQASLHSALSFISDDSARAVIPSAAGIEIIGEPRPAQLGAVRIGMVARLDPWKGQELLIRSFAAAQLPKGSTLHFYGGAPFGNNVYFDTLIALVAELNIADQVVFHGHVQDVTAAIDSLDICVQSSIRAEPLGQNVLQYLSRGKAVIVANEGGPVEWVTPDENGLVFQARNGASLAAALTRLGAEPETRDRLSAAAILTNGLVSDAEIRRMHLKFFTVCTLAAQGDAA